MAFYIASARRYVRQQLVQRYPLLLLYPSIKCILQRLLLLLCIRDAEEAEGP